MSCQAGGSEGGEAHTVAEARVRRQAAWGQREGQLGQPGSATATVCCVFLDRVGSDAHYN